MNQPNVLDEVELLRRYRTQKSYSDAQLGAEMTAIGGEWTSTYLAKVFAGKARPGEEQREFFRRFLSIKYYWANLA